MVKLIITHFLWQTLSSQAALTYDEVVREMMLAEGQYIRDLNMIIKVLRIYFEFSLLHYCFTKYFETHLLEVVNGCCMEDEFESQPVLVSHGL